jgi:hypothetical protein
LQKSVGGGVHPSEAEGFDWDDGNEDELARHHITPHEVEQVFDNEPTWGANKRLAAGKWLMVGRTNGGRVLTIVVRHDPAHPSHYGLAQQHR